MFDWVPGNQKVNQNYYKEALTTLCEQVKRKRPEWKNNSWIIHQDNIPANNALSVTTFLAKHESPVLTHIHILT